MKLIAQVLVATLLAHLLSPLPSLAQQPQSAEASIGQLREQIAKLEKVDRDPAVSDEVKALNREFLEERRARLNALVGRRAESLRQYLAAVGDSLNQRERQAVEDSIRALTGETRVAEPVAPSGPAYFVQAIAATPAGGGAPYRGSLLPTAREAAAPPQDRTLAGSPGQQGGQKKDDKNTLVIDTKPEPTAVPTPMEVQNGATVTVRGSKSFVNKCEVTTKREELKPEPNPIAQLLKIIVGLGTIPLGSLTAEDAEKTFCPSADVAVPPDPEAERVEAEIASFRKRLVNVLREVDAERQEFEQRARRISQFARCIGPDINDKGNFIVVKGAHTYDQKRDICRGEEVPYKEKKLPLFDKEKMLLLGDLETLLSIKGTADQREPPSIESVELQMATLKKALTDGYKKKGGDEEALWLESVNARLDCLAKNLEVARKSRAYLQNTRGEFEAFYEALNRLKPASDEAAYIKVLIADSNAKLTGTVACTNYFTKQSAFDPVPFTVTYQPFSPHALTGGVLFSTLGRRQIGGVGVFFRRDEVTNAPITRVTIAETDTSQGQVIPFTFYNYRFWGGPKLGMNASGGVGVNPGNGPVQVEFFAGGALNIRNFFVQMGAHFGRWQDLGGGLTIGDLLPEGASAPTLPIERRYTIRPSVGVSYKLPLP